MQSITEAHLPTRPSLNCTSVMVVVGYSYAVKTLFFDPVLSAVTDSTSPFMQRRSMSMAWHPAESRLLPPPRFVVFQRYCPYQGPMPWK